MPVLGTQKPCALTTANATQQSQPQVESISYTYTLYASIFIEKPLVVIPPPHEGFQAKRAYNMAYNRAYGKIPTIY